VHFIAKLFHFTSDLGSHLFHIIAKLFHFAAYIFQRFPYLRYVLFGQGNPGFYVMIVVILMCAHFTISLWYFYCKRSDIDGQSAQRGGPRLPLALPEHPPQTTPRVSGRSFSLLPRPPAHPGGRFVSRAIPCYTVRARKERTRMTFQSFEAEARQSLANVISDAEAVAGDLSDAAASPVIAPFLAQLEAGMTAVLNEAGLPAEKIEKSLAQILSVLNKVSQKVASKAVKAAAKRKPGPV
jgi:hypothetical protein